MGFYSLLGFLQTTIFALLAIVYNDAQLTDLGERMSIRAVIFDLGGVINRTEDRNPRTRLAERAGMSYDDLMKLVFDTESAIQATLGKVTTREHWEIVRKILDVSAEELSPVESHFWGGDKVDFDLVKYIRSLRPKYKTGLLSNAWDDLRYYLEKEWKIADAFDEIVISAEVGVAKPDPRIYQIALERLGVAPQEAIFVDDYPANIEGASRLGIHAIRFQNLSQAVNEIEALLNSKSPTQ
jgi:epoxide hydrolase-like predicted phosphatase